MNILASTMLPAHKTYRTTAIAQCYPVKKSSWDLWRLRKSNLQVHSTNCQQINIKNRQEPHHQNSYSCAKDVSNKWNTTTYDHKTLWNISSAHRFNCPNLKINVRTMTLIKTVPCATTRFTSFYKIKNIMHKWNEKNLLQLYLPYWNNRLMISSF